MSRGLGVGVGALALGAGIFALALSGSGRAMRRADTGESFALHMRAHRGDVRRVEPNQASTWWARVQPQADRARVEFLLDDASVVATLEALDDAPEPDAEVARRHELRLPPLSPGVHRIEARVRRRGERVTSIVTSVLAGEFEARGAMNARCGAAISVSPRALRRALLPPLRDKLLAAVRGQPFIGDRPRLGEMSLELLDQSVRARVRIEGDNSLEVVARIAIARAGDQRLSARLEALEAVHFRGQARNWARGGGLGVGALLGGPIGAVAGLLIVDSFVDSKSHELVRTQVRRALRQASELDLIPTQVALLPDETRSQVALAFCEDPQVSPAGVRVSFRVAPMSFAAKADWPLEGPLTVGGELPTRVLGNDEDLRADLHIDVINALLESWASTGMLQERLVSRERVAHVNAELEPWTPLRLGEVKAALPPMLSEFSASDRSHASPRVMVDWPMLGLEIKRSDGVPVAPGERVDLSVRAWVELIWQGSTGSLRARAGAQAAWMGCVRDEGANLVRRACFGPLLDAADLPARVDTGVRDGAAALPPLELGALLRGSMGLRIAEGDDAVRVRAESGSALSLAATLNNENSNGN